MSRGGDWDGRARSLRSDERSISELLGAILVFSLILLLLVLAQVTLVPTLNAQVEYEHSLRSSDDLGDLQASGTRVASSGSAEGTNVELGVTYPNRPLLINPGPVQGVIETTDPEPQGVVLQNVVTPENAETNDYWADGPAGVGVYETRILTYHAQYNEHRGGGRTYVEGGTVAFTRFESADVVRSSSANLVDGRRISLVVFGGDYQRITDGSTMVPLTPISAPSQTVSITDDGNPISITIKTFLSEAKWRDRLALEPHVIQSQITYTDSGYPNTPNELTVVLEPGITYELRMAKVGIGTGTVRTDAAYLTREAGSPSVVPPDGGQIAVDVRDAFNNPVSGTEVTFEIVPGTAVNGTATLSNGTTTGQTVTVRSDGSGRATATLSGDAERATIEATILSGTPEHERVEFNVQIGSEGAGARFGDASEINPNADGEFVLLESRFFGCTGNKCDGVIVTFEARNTTKALTEMRMPFYQTNAPGASASDLPGFARLSQEKVGAAGTWDGLSPEIEMAIGGPYVDVTQLSTVNDDVVSYRFTIYQADGDVFSPEGGNQFALRIQFADGSVATYVMNPYESSAP